jgi:hypothetical protein
MKNCTSALIMVLAVAKATRAFIYNLVKRFEIKRQSV